MKRSRRIRPAPIFTWRAPRAPRLPRPSARRPLFFIGAAVALSLLRVHFKTESVRIGYRLAERQQERFVLQGERALLEVEKATLERLERIERLATAQGMVYPAARDQAFLGRMDVAR